MTHLSRVGCAGIGLLIACESPTPPAAAGGLGVQVVIPPGQSRILDGGRYHLEGPTPRVANVTPGDLVNISGLRPGTYSLTLEGLIGGELDLYGKTSDIEVVDGADTPVTVTMGSFVPVLNPLSPMSSSKTFGISFSSVPGAEVYRVETAGNSTFSLNVDSANTTVTTPNVTVPVDGSYFVRVRAKDGFNVPGRASDFDTIRVQACINCWLSRAALPAEREYPAVAAMGGLIYAAGGDQGLPALTTFQSYDPRTNSWTVLAGMLTPRTQFGVAAVGGVVYAIGGVTTGFGVINEVDAYDPRSNSWSRKIPMPTARSNFGVGVVNGIIYVVGGDTLGTVEAYDPVGNSWSTRAPLPSKRVFLGVAGLNGLLYAVGGRQGISEVATVEAYDPGTNSWTPRASMSVPRNVLGVGVINGLLYAVGGQNFTDGELTVVEAYSPALNAWAPRASLPAPRGFLGVGVVDDLLYAVGGSFMDGALPNVDVYEP